jgi:hypothetical protein
MAAKNTPNAVNQGKESKQLGDRSHQGRTKKYQPPIRSFLSTVTRASKIVQPIPLGTMMFDGKGIITPQAKGKNRASWGTGVIGEERRRLGPGILEQACEHLPKDMLVKFVLFSGDPKQPTPSKLEFGRFERRLLESVRRVLNQQLRERIEKLPRPVGRRERKAARTQLIVDTWEGYRRKKWSRTAAAKQTAKDLTCDRATVWRHLAAVKKH